MKKLLLTALMLVLGLQALPAGAAAAAQPFVRWAVYSSEAQNTPALFEAVTAYNNALQKDNAGRDHGGLLAVGAGLALVQDPLLRQGLAAPMAHGLIGFQIPSLGRVRLNDHPALQGPAASHNGFKQRDNLRPEIGVLQQLRLSLEYLPFPLLI